MAIDTETYKPTVDLPDIPSTEGIQEGYQETAQSILDTPTEATEEYQEPEIGRAEEGKSFVEPEATVQYQMSELLKQDSPYMRAIETGARESAQNLGLLSSSMSVGAGQLAGIKGAMPIAQQDAETYAKAGLAQQGAQNQAFMTGVEGQVSGELQKQKYGLLNQSQALQASFDTLSKGMDQESAAKIQETSRQWDFALQDSMKRLEYQLSDQLNQQQMDATTAENVRGQAASMIENNQISIENMLKDPDMLELGTATLQKNINNMINMTTASVQFLYDSAKLNVDGYIGDLLTDLESVISW